MQTDTVVIGPMNIRIQPKTKDKLSALGKHGDSFNSIIEMLLYEHALLEAIARDHPEIITKKK